MPMLGKGPGVGRGWCCPRGHRWPSLPLHWADGFQVPVWWAHAPSLPRPRVAGLRRRHGDSPERNCCFCLSPCGAARGWGSFAVAPGQQRLAGDVEHELTTAPSGPTCAPRPPCGARGAAGVRSARGFCGLRPEPALLRSGLFETKCPRNGCPVEQLLCPSHPSGAALSLSAASLCSSVERTTQFSLL